MNEFEEAIKGFTDIPIALLSLAFALFLCIRRSKDDPWGRIFACIAAAAVLGATVHIVDFSIGWLRAIWIVLYVLLFEACRLFASRMFVYAGVGESKTATAVLEGVLYVTSVVLLFVWYEEDILAFVLYAILLFVRVVVALAQKKGSLPRLLLASIGALAFPIVMQAVADWVPYAVVWEHIALALILSLLFIVAKNEKTERE